MRDFGIATCVGARTHTIKIEIQNVVLSRVETAHVARYRSYVDS